MKVQVLNANNVRVYMSLDEVVANDLIGEDGLPNAEQLRSVAYHVLDSLKLVNTKVCRRISMSGEIDMSTKEFILDISIGEEVPIKPLSPNTEHVPPEDLMGVRRMISDEKKLTNPVIEKDKTAKPGLDLCFVTPSLDPVLDFSKMSEATAVPGVTYDLYKNADPSDHCFYVRVHSNLDLDLATISRLQMLWIEFFDEVGQPFSFEDFDMFCADFPSKLCLL